MKLEELKSKAELSKFIESYWSFDGHDGVEMILLPDGTFNVLIAEQSFISELVEYPRGVYISPLLIQPIKIVTNGRIYGIRFKAFSLSNVIGKNASQVDAITELEHLIKQPKNLNNWFQQFDFSTDLSIKKTSLENAAFDLLNHQYGLNEQLRAQVNYILDRKGNIRIEELCSEAGISRQGLHKNFIQHLGIGAKALATTWRLNHFFTLMSDDNKLTHSALDAGFYDQAHSIHTFKNHWQLSPGIFQKTNPVLFTYAKEVMSKRFSNFYDPEI
ncbi:MAG: helix-turn-helix domain-containing protein [Crocinitomicaceae bacterium]|nr:helix-turn-helix domain-containing protein [Crocinitomicaceae bacterium]